MRIKYFITFLACFSITFAVTLSLLNFFIRPNLGQQDPKKLIEQYINIAAQADGTTVQHEQILDYVQRGNEVEARVYVQGFNQAYGGASNFTMIIKFYRTPWQLQSARAVIP